jgi:hypothetical protein
VLILCFSFFSHFIYLCIKTSFDSIKNKKKNNKKQKDESNKWVEDRKGSFDRGGRGGARGRGGDRGAMRWRRSGKSKWGQGR